MDRRRILLIVAVIVALLGTALVFLYVRGADARAEDRFETVEVLTAEVVRTDLTRVASDHLPLSVDIRLRPGDSR